MTNLTGNNNQNNPSSGLPEGLTAIPDLVYPALEWADEDYAHLQARLDLYTDFVLLSKFQSGQVTEQYLVDPVEVATALAGINLNSGLLPRETLFWSRVNGQDRLGVYLPPQVWLVTIRDQAEAWRVPLPGLVFVGQGYDYSLWAVTERPTTSATPLYLAPCPNVHPEGVCRGNAPFPKAAPATIWQAVDAFFSSRFNRDLSNQKSQAYPDCVLDQWQALYEAEAETYPLADLVQTHLTLGRLIDDR
jgi:PRTRC genetic system protein B